MVPNQLGGEVFDGRVRHEWEIEMGIAKKTAWGLADRPCTPFWAKLRRDPSQKMLKKQYFPGYAGGWAVSYRAVKIFFRMVVRANYP